MFINLALEIMTIPELDFSLVQKFAQLLTSLLKLADVIICTLVMLSEADIVYGLSVCVCVCVCTV